MIWHKVATGLSWGLASEHQSKKCKLRPAPTWTPTRSCLGATGLRSDPQLGHGPASLQILRALLTKCLSKIYFEINRFPLSKSLLVISPIAFSPKYCGTWGNRPKRHGPYLKVLPGTCSSQSLPPQGSAQGHQPGTHTHSCSRQTL